MLRVGSVPYLVGRPLDWGLGDEPDLRLEHAVPAKLVHKLRNDELDVALVSSIELFRRPGYRFLEGLAVAGQRTVSSVQVFLRKPIEEVRRLALDPASRTAATLVRIVWPTRERPHFEEVPEGSDPRELAADAWLRIGDRALQECVEEDAAPVFNPSAEWARRTGLPFVFAVWIVRPGIDVSPWAGAFRRARARGREHLEELVIEGAKAWKLEEAFVRRYLGEECCFDLGPELGAALTRFRDEASRLGLGQADLPLRPLRLPEWGLSGSAPRS